MTIRTSIALGALAAFASASAAFAASGPLSLGSAAPDAVAAYHLHFDGSFWNGQVKKYEHDITLTSTAGTGVRAVVAKQETSQRVEFTAKRNADGTLDSSNPGEQLGAYNTAARLVSAASASPGAGAQWDAKIPVPLIDGSNVDVPVHAKVVSADGDRVVVQATGTHAASVTYNGFTVPLEFTITLASSFAGGKFQRLDYAVDEVVHAGPQTQTMHWTASLEAR